MVIQNNSVVNNIYVVLALSLIHDSEKFTVLLWDFIQSEMELVLNVGVDPSRIIYANPYKQASHIR